MFELHGLGHFHPTNEITNQFLEDLDIGTNEKWIMERVGIRSRRTAMSLDYIRTTRNQDFRAALEATEFTNAYAGARAAEMAIARAGIAKQDIGLVIAGTSAADTMSPAEACNVARELNLDVPGFDINSACTSFYAGMYALSLMQPDKLPAYVLLVTPERLTTTVNYNDRSSAVLWGDAATAAILSTQVKGRVQVLGNRLESNPAGSDKVVVPRDGFFHQEGRTVQMFAIKKTIRMLGQLRDEFSDGERTLHFVGHQANLRMLESVCQQMKIPPERHHYNVDRFGNTASAGAPSVISMLWDQWTAHDDIAAAGVGSGLTWGGLLLRFRGEA